ncbi:MAG: tetratricopeptide repeat protein, partial [Anaerotignaceae bacterium]
MVCQNCGKPINKISICPTCHSDNTIFVKAKNASIRQYNKGVTAAKEGDYSTAINCLNQCILFDKRNYMARNLLGIAYYEVGMVADALRQWIISKSLKAEKNPATKYIDAIQGSQRLLEKQEDSITMFNSALTKFRLNNKDLGVIQLKNALTLNPKLVEANNLLAAYYISENDIQKAKLHISKTLNIDKRNPKALEYLSLITHDHIVNNKNATYNTGYNEKPNFTYRLNFFPKKELFTFVAGAIIASVIATVLIFPEIKNNLFVQVQNLQSE